MHKSSKLLFLYGLIASSLMFFWAIFFKPQPENFGLILLLLPMVLFFWINTRAMALMKKPDEETGHHKNSLSMKIGIIILAGLFVSTASIYGFSALNSTYSPQSQKYLKLAIENTQAINDLKTEIENMQKSQFSNGNLLSQINEMKTEFENSKFEQENKETVLGISRETEKLVKQLNQASTSALTQDLEAKYITLINNETSQARIYKEGNFLSDVVERINYGQKYPVLKSEGSWLLISADSGEQGWILEKYVKEVD